MVIDEGGGNDAGLKLGMGQHIEDEGDVGLDTTDAALLEDALHASKSLGKVGTTGGVLDQHGIVVGGDGKTGVANAIHADTTAGRMTVDGDGTSVGSKVFLGILGGNTALNGNATGANVLLDQTNLVEGGAGSNAKLGLDDVHAGDLFRNGVLDLDAGIDLNEVGLHVGSIDQELDRTSVLVVGTGGQIAGILVQLLAQVIGQGPAGGHLNDLLMTSLDGAIAFVQMDDIAGAVAEDLDLNVTGTLDELLHEDGTVAEAGQRLAGRRLEQGLDVLHVADDAHALAAAAHGGLDDDGQAVLVDEGLDLLSGLEGTVGSGDDGDAGLDGGLTGAGLVGEGVEVLNSRSDECNAAVGTCLGELGRLRQEAVSRVDGIDAGLLGDGDDLRDVQVGRDGGGRILLLEQEGLVGSPTMLRVAILVTVDGDCLE